MPLSAQSDQSELECDDNRPQQKRCEQTYAPEKIILDDLHTPFHLKKDSAKSSHQDQRWSTLQKAVNIIGSECISNIKIQMIQLISL